MFQNKKLLSRICRLAIAVTAILPLAATANDDKTEAQVEVAKSLLKFGAIPARLLWEGTLNASPDNSDGDAYVRLGEEVHRQIAYGRVGSALIKSNFDIISSTALYAAAVDPEPVTNVTLGVVAYSAQQAGSYFGDKIMEQSRSAAYALLRRAMKDTDIKASDLQKMGPDKIASAFKDWKVGTAKLGDILADEPGALEIIQAHARDLQGETAIATLLATKEIEGDTKAIKASVVKTSDAIKHFRIETNARLDDANDQLSKIGALVESSRKALDEVRKDQSKSSHVTQALAQISYMGWTTSQKLSAIESGLLPDLDPAQSSALQKSLRADLQREETIRSLQTTVGDLGKLSQIASNLGLNPSVTMGLSAAQTGVTAVAQYLSGDYLGAVASVTSLVGLGRPNAAAQQQQQMMAYLDKQFGEVNKKLDEVLRLQKETLEAINVLHKEIVSVQRSVESVEVIVLLNNTLLRRIASAQWDPCGNVYTALNGNYQIVNKAALVSVLSSLANQENIQKCFGQFENALKNWRDVRRWNSDIIDATFYLQPTVKVDVTPKAADDYVQYVAQLTRTRELTRSFLAMVLDRNLGIVRTALRFSQPMKSVAGARSMTATFDSASGKLDALTCGDLDADGVGLGKDDLSIGLKSILCFGTRVVGNDKPQQNTWDEILNATALGPNVTHLIDLGLTLGVLSDFGIAKTKTSSWEFASSEQIVQAATKVSPTLLHAVDERKGERLVRNLMTLADAFVLQQSMQNGEYTAELIADVLYDKSKRTLITVADPAKPNDAKVVAALSLLRANPTLARNVVMLAMRRALTDGGRDPALSETFFAISRSKLSSSDACIPGNNADRNLKELFPNWTFEFRATSQKHSVNVLVGIICPSANENSDQGSGASVRFDKDFYVTLPSARVLAEGAFETTAGLRLALQYRDRVNQAMIDRTIARRDGLKELIARDRTPLVLLGASVVQR